MSRLIVKPLADADLRALRRISQANFGPLAARRYNALVRRAYRLLCSDPRQAGVKEFNGAVGKFLFHLRHARVRGAAPKQPRHFIVFSFDDATLTILRVLHDSMDVEQHVSDGDAEG